MNSATVSPVMSTPSLPRRGAASSVNSSVLSSNSSSEAESVKPFTCIPEYCFPSSESPLEGSPGLPLPPAAYADSDEEPYICTKQFPCSQNSDGAVSGETSSHKVKATPLIHRRKLHQKPEKVHVIRKTVAIMLVYNWTDNSKTANLSGKEDPSQKAVVAYKQDDDIGNLSLSSEVHPAGDDVVVKRQICGGNAENSPPSPGVASSVSSSCSPVAKRGRFGSSCARDVSNLCMVSYREESTHALGTLFMDAQKKEGASWADRRDVVMRALVDMKKRKHTL
ncbi:hypothetical protein COOONC_24486, partial [Cooperia oncophora]